MSKSLSISDARARLPELVRYLQRSPGGTVFIEHRDMDERLALITESRLRYLESLVASCISRRGSFKLAGSMKSDLTDAELERALASLRRDEATLAEEKTAKL